MGVGVVFGVHVTKEILTGFLFDVTEVAGVVDVVVPKIGKLVD